MSSASIIHKPEAPTAAFDLGIFSKVLLYKQSKFDAGADLVQGQINQLENTQVIGEAQKKYLSEKVNGIIEGVNGMGGMDFSDRNVINQTSNYVNSITKDPIITTAIANTRSIQKGTAYFEKLKADAAAGKKGVYYNPANEYDYMDGVNDYLRKSKTDVSAAYQERPITPPVDVNKQLMETAKQVVASSYTERDGSNMYILKNGDVVTPERLYETALTQIQTDPNLANQIRINAKYNYLQKDAAGNINPLQLEGIRNTYIQGTENKIRQLQSENVRLGTLLAASGDPKEQVALQAQIDKVSGQLNDYESNRTNRYNEINTLLRTNPEAAAANVYTNKLLEGIVAAKAFRKENVKFDQAAMFVDKMNFEKSKEQFDQNLAEKKFALEQADFALKAQKQAADIAKDTGSVDGATGGIVSEEVSLPSNLRKSSSSTQVDQIRGVEMQQANVKQDFYHYLYQFKNSAGLVTKVGNTYQPTAAGKDAWENQMKMRQDLRNGVKIPTTLDPEFIKLANKYDDLALVKKQYTDVMVDVNREALQIKRKELGLNDADYELFLKGKSIVEQLPEQVVPTPFATTPVRAKRWDMAPQDPESKKAFDTYFKYNRDLKVDDKIVENIYTAKGKQIIPRSYTPVGLKEADLKARSGALITQIANRGYYSLDGSAKPEVTRGQDFAQDKIKYIGDFFGDLGNGAKPYVKAQVTRGNGKDETTETIFVDVDDTYASNFRSFALNVNEAARQQVLREQSLDYNSSSSDGRNVVGTKIVKVANNPSDESAVVQIYVTHDEKGNRITPHPIIVEKTKGYNINQSVEYAKKFADEYAEYYRQALKLGKKPSVASYVDRINKLHTQK